MIDIETMGLGPGAAIVSIGAVVFDPRYGKVTDDTFYVELDWKAQKRVEDHSTRAWWAKQPAQAQKALKGEVGLIDALDDLAFFLPDDCKVWGNGPTFDIAILENAHNDIAEPYPWKFWNVRCCRTIRDLYESSRGGLEKGYGNNHNALEDAINQAKAVCFMWAKILGGG